METLSDSELAFLELLARIWTARRKIWRSAFVLLIDTRKIDKEILESTLLSIDRNLLCSAIRIYYKITKGSKLATKLT